MNHSKDYKEQHEIIRQKLWCDVWSNTARSDSCVKLETPTKYADEALKQFDKRFNEGSDHER